MLNGQLGIECQSALTVAGTVVYWNYFTTGNAPLYMLVCTVQDFIIPGGFSSVIIIVLCVCMHTCACVFGTIVGSCIKQQAYFYYHVLMMVNLA